MKDHTFIHRCTTFHTSLHIKVTPPSVWWMNDRLWLNIWFCWWHHCPCNTKETQITRKYWRNVSSLLPLTNGSWTNDYFTFVVKLSHIYRAKWIAWIYPCSLWYSLYVIVYDGKVFYGATVIETCLFLGEFDS